MTTQPKSWAAGWNRPGYLPEGDDNPFLYASWREARDALVWELERADFADQEAEETLAWGDALDHAIATLQGAVEGEACAVPFDGWVFFVEASREDPQ